MGCYATLLLSQPVATATTGETPASIERNLQPRQHKDDSDGIEEDVRDD